MFCKNCGKEINDKAVVCPHCGVQVNQLVLQSSTQGNPIAIVGFIFSFFITLVGLICSIVGYSNAKSGAPHKGLALAGIIISSLKIFLFVFIIILAITV